ncbi:MAG: OmpA family protein [Myxococcota bacterium]|nr:OmpA family protein [Myxococcota bacterium]
MMSVKSKVVVLASILAAGCATGGLTRQDILRQYDVVNQLSLNLADARGKGSELLAPEAHAKANELLEKAVSLAKDAKKDEANRAAKEGLSVYDQMVETMTVVNDEFSEVLETRERAKAEGADSLYASAFKKADASLKSATRLIEDRKLSEARKRHPELIAAYADLEVKALKEGTKAAAEAAVKKAEDMDADDYAPKTLDKAKAELALVSSVLEADRTNTEKANERARLAIWFAGRAMDITALAKMFDEDDYEFEDIVLWHQAQLEVINAPLQQDLPFDESDAAAVKSIRSAIEGLLTAIEDMRKMSAARQKKMSKEMANLMATHKAQLEELRQQLEGMQKASKSEIAKLQAEAASKLAAAEAARQQSAAAEKRFDDVQALFVASEAYVSRKGDNIVIDAHGFDFPRRSVDIGSKNFGILDKIVTAINIFPKATVLVTGHTDSKGSEDRNLKLSIGRAESVAEFLTTVGKINPKRVQSKGMGENAPVASNDSKDGREKNRRIEVLIINE